MKLRRIESRTKRRVSVFWTTLLIHSRSHIVRIMGFSKSSSHLLHLRSCAIQFAFSYTVEQYYRDLIPKCHSISRQSGVISRITLDISVALFWLHWQNISV